MSCWSLQDEPALIRNLLPVPSILAGIRAHYWETPGPDALTQAFAGGLTLQELRTLRRGLLEMVEVVMKASVDQNLGMHLDDVQVSFACRLIYTLPRGCREARSPMDVSLQIV